MKAQIVPFEDGHFRHVWDNLRPEDAADTAGLDADCCYPTGGARTLLVDGVAAGVFCAAVSEGTARLFTLSTLEVKRAPLLVCKAGRALIRECLEQGAHRVEAYCHRDNDAALRWLGRSLGFTVEGLLRRSGPNAQDRFVLSILPDEWRFR